MRYKFTTSIIHKAANNKLTNITPKQVIFFAFIIPS